MGAGYAPVVDAFTHELPGNRLNRKVRNSSILGNGHGVGVCVVRRDPQRYLALYLIVIARIGFFVRLYVRDAHLSPLNSLHCNLCSFVSHPRDSLEAKFG